MPPTPDDAPNGGPIEKDDALQNPHTRGSTMPSTSHPAVPTSNDEISTMQFPVFPHTPYGIQLDLMRSLYATLKRGGIGVFESPTGTGKTLSTLCAALQWLEDEKKEKMRGGGNDDGDGDGNDDGDKNDIEPDWLRDFDTNKRGRDEHDKEMRRRDTRAKARKRAAEADYAFESSQMKKGSGAFGGWQKNKTNESGKEIHKSKSAAEVAAVAAYAAAITRGASKDQAIEEAEFLADDWSDEHGVSKSDGAYLKSLRGDDTSSDEDDEVLNGKHRGIKRFGAKDGKDTDSIDNPDLPTYQIIFCSRTHSQLTQVVGELRSTVFGGGGVNNSGIYPNSNPSTSAVDRQVAAVAVAGRRQLCVNPEVLATVGTSAARLNERCLELGEEGRKKSGGKKEKEDKNKKTKTAKQPSENTKQKGCPFLTKRRAAVSELAEELLATPMDIEDLATAGVKRKACPYYASREAHPFADIVFAPYSSLLHPETRESLGINLSNAVIIFDEAHNLADAVHGVFGAILSGVQIKLVHGMIEKYTERFYSRLSPGNLRHLRTLKLLCTAFLKTLKGADDDTPSKTSTIKTLNDFLFDAGCDAVNFFALTKYLKESKIAHKICGYAEVTQETGVNDLYTAWDNWDDDSLSFGVGSLSTTLQGGGDKKQRPGVGSVHALAAFVSALASADADGRVLVERDTSTDQKGSNGQTNTSDGVRLKFVLLDSAARFKSVVDTAKAVVLVGGTLSPINELALQLFPDSRMVDETEKPYEDGSKGITGGVKGVTVSDGTTPPTPVTPSPPKLLSTISCGHVVPSDALLPLAVKCGPSGKLLDFSFKQRHGTEMIDELGRVVANACQVAPGGVVVFFPSFAYADLVYQRWVESGITQRIAKVKTIFREPRAAADVEVALRSFAAAVERGAKRKEENAMSSQSQNNRTGALMLCVCGGKLSEGINFKDQLGRLVIMVGLPYANAEEPELAARMKYLDEHGSAGGMGITPENTRNAKRNVQGKSRGRAYYEALCMRSVNQSVGRAIRHVGDYAAILFCDKRFAPAGQSEKATGSALKGVPGQLAGWIGERLVTPKGYGQTQAALATFFTQKRKEGR